MFRRESFSSKAFSSKSWRFPTDSVQAPPRHMPVVIDGWRYEHEEKQRRIKRQNELILALVSAAVTGEML